jgi:4a-hydroxytetrahydrobiopterin dehydratase
MAHVLSTDEVAAALAGLPGWSGDASAISRTVTAPSFLAGIRLVDAVAEAAEKADHHPDVDIRYTRITFRLSTHSAGGVTAKDLALAGELDTLAGAHGAT